MNSSGISRKSERTAPGAINRKISSIRSYIKYFRFRQIEGAEELPIENLGRAREPYRGPQEPWKLMKSSVFFIRSIDKVFSGLEIFFFIVCFTDSVCVLAKPFQSILRILIGKTKPFEFMVKGEKNGHYHWLAIFQTS